MAARHPRQPAVGGVNDVLCECRAKALCHSDALFRFAAMLKFHFCPTYFTFSVTSTGLALTRRGALSTTTRLRLIRGPQPACQLYQRRAHRFKGVGVNRRRWATVFVEIRPLAKHTSPLHIGIPDQLPQAVLGA